jgi:hypothetical protein
MEVLLVKSATEKSGPGHDSVEWCREEKEWEGENAALECKSIIPSKMVMDKMIQILEDRDKIRKCKRGAEDAYSGEQGSI